MIERDNELAARLAFDIGERIQQEKLMEARKEARKEADEHRAIESVGLQKQISWLRDEVEELKKENDLLKKILKC